MYFVQFPVSTTNIFPLANSEAGGQLMSEWNLRAMDSVSTDPSIKYSVGPSYVHSADDFRIWCATDGASVDSSTIQILPGRAIVNGHYVESLSEINIDIAAVNYKASQEGVPVLKGELAIGLVMMYSTYQTLSASALPENEDGYYEGIRIVIVPKADVRRPIDVPGEHQYSEVNMHLLLGTFSYMGGQVTSVHIDDDKTKFIDASRVGDLSTSLSDEYVTKVGLDPHHLYVYAGKGQNDDGTDTWCASEGSLMIWKSNPQLTAFDPPSSTEANFRYNYATDTTELVLPPKQIDGAKDQQGRYRYFPENTYTLPTANFSGRGGVVGQNFVRRILADESKLNQFYRLPNGKMRKYIPELTIDPADTSKYGEDGALPVIPLASEPTPADVSAKFQRVYSDLSVADDNLSDAILRLDNLISSSIPAVSEGASLASNKLSIASSKLSLCQTNSDELYAGIHGGLPVATLDSLIDSLNNNLNQCSTNLSESITTVNAINQSSIVLADQANVIRNELNAVKSALNSVTLTVQDIEDTFEETINMMVQRELDKQAVFTTLSWSPGDYVLVGSDHTQGVTSNGTYPSTMYMVKLGQILAIKYVDVLERTFDPTSETYVTERDAFLHTVVKPLSGGVELARLVFEDDTRGTSEDPDFPAQPDVSVFANNNIDVTTYEGAPNVDYFVVYTINRATDTAEYWKAYYYTPSKVSLDYEYTIPPLLVSGGVPLATESVVGGFLSVDANNMSNRGKGYVYRDEDGNLRILDYELLVLGIQATQYGQDRSEGAGLSLTALQTELDEYVNDRICYPNDNQIKNAEDNGVDPHILHLYLTLPSDTEGGILTIHDIGSRYNSYLYVHIMGSATSNTKLIFENCEKLRIDSNVEGSPQIVLKNVNLYYDANVLDLPYMYEDPSTGATLMTGIENLSLWYEKESGTDPDLQVDGMTVTLVGNIETVDSFDPWKEHTSIDSHYFYALRSITFASDGSIINVGMIVGDSSTIIGHDDTGTSLYRNTFSLPQNTGLQYPSTKMTHLIKVTGTFVSCYYSYSENAYMVKQTDFSAMTQKYSVLLRSNEAQGSIAFCTNAQYVNHITGVAETETVDVWDLNKPHIFYGGSIE